MAELLIHKNSEDRDIPTFLEPYIQSGNLNFLIGSGASFPAIKTAGDIEKEINDLLTAGKEDEADRKSLEFIEEIDDVHERLKNPGDNAEIAEVVSNYQNFISIIDWTLFERKNLLLPRQANLFTTNYDMFIEHAASLCPSAILNDGFDRSAGLGAEFVFAPERYFDRTYRAGSLYGHQTEIPTINLVKLHGSLSWRRKADSIVFKAGAAQKLSNDEKNEPKKVKAHLEQHFLILPNFHKFHATLMERTYYDLLRLFSNAMDRENVVLICFGFSFADEHILDITRRALRNPTAHLVIFSYSHASAADYQAKFSKQRNVTIIAPETASTIGFKPFNQMLTAILPKGTNDHQAASTG